jgi:hypothetical protein
MNGGEHRFIKPRTSEAHPTMLIMRKQFVYTLAALAVLASGEITTARADLTSAGLSSWSITGDFGDVLALNGTTVASGRLITGTTLFYNSSAVIIDPSAPSEPAANADDFSLATSASADAKAYQVTLFPEATKEILFLEKNGNDPSIFQGLDISGAPIGASLFVNSGSPKWVGTGFNSNNSGSGAIQQAFGMVLTSDVPIYGFRLTGADATGTPTATSGFDPVSIMAVIPEPGAVSLFGLGGLMLLWRRR